MTLQIAALPLLAFCLFGACSEDGKKAETKKVSEEQGIVDDFSLEQAQEGLAEIKEALKKGEDAKYECAASESYAGDLISDAGKKVAAELAKICGFDVPMAAASKALEEAETARKAKPDEEMLSECYSAYWDMASEEISKKHADNAEFLALVKRWQAACPAKK